MTEKSKRIDIDCTGEDLKQAALGVAIYCKRLDGLRAVAEKMGKTKLAETLEREAEGLRAELLEGLEKGRNGFLPQHLPVLVRGLQYLVHNRRAAVGTVRPLGYELWVEQLKKDADHVAATVIPKFEEQRSLAFGEE